jgi:hypothetical protein
VKASNAPRHKPGISHTAIKFQVRLSEGGDEGNKLETNLLVKPVNSEKQTKSSGNSDWNIDDNDGSGCVGGGCGGCR